MCSLRASACLQLYSNLHSIAFEDPVCSLGLHIWGSCSDRLVVARLQTPSQARRLQSPKSSHARLRAIEHVRRNVLHKILLVGFYRSSSMKVDDILEIG